MFNHLGDSGFLVDILVYIGAIAEYGRIPLSFFEIDEVEDTISGALYIVAETSIDPTFLDATYGNSDDVKFFFRFDRTF